jgi:hypothetical protein
MNSVMSGALMVGGLYNVLWGKRMEQALGKQQGRSAGNTARFDFEEQERGAPVPGTQDLIKPLPGAR